MDDLLHFAKSGHFDKSETTIDLNIIIQRVRQNLHSQNRDSHANHTKFTSCDGS